MASSVASGAGEVRAALRVVASEAGEVRAALRVVASGAGDGRAVLRVVASGAGEVRAALRVVASGAGEVRAVSGVGNTEILAALRGAPVRAGLTRVLAIDGRSGAGKTRLAAELAAELGAPIVSLEDLYGGWDGLERGIDLLVSEVLEPLTAGRAARVPRYDWVARAWAEPTVLEPPEMLIVEGVGAGARRAAAFESLLVWLDAPTAVRKQRALDRDGETFAPYWDRWAAQEDAMLARERTPERSGLVIATG